jgi:hypothetical protein
MPLSFRQGPAEIHVFCHLAISLGSYLGVANKNLPPNILYPLTFRINCVGIITSVPTDYHIEDAQKN